MKRLLLLFIVVLLSGCNPVVRTSIAPSSNKHEITPTPSNAEWWRTAVFYEIFVRSFYDSDGDGIGDLKGLTQKLDYLNDGNPKTTDDLGITGIWLMPINPAMSYHGYDVTNYYDINPDYGTLEDFKVFLDEAHKRGIRVIIDLVLNHTSSRHPFFIEAVSDVESVYHDWYIWSDTNQGERWHEIPGNTGEYYYGYFDAAMPDLNYENPEVTTEMENVVSYWLGDVKVDGFRIDAAKHLIEEGTKLENTTKTHDWFRSFYPFYKSINKDAFIVGEVSGSTARVTTTYSGDQMDMIFNFELASSFVSSAGGGSNSSVNSGVIFTMQEAPDWNFATFLTNHDQDRVLSDLGGNVGKAKVAASILLTSPGTPFIYYGEEIGMRGVKPDEDIRLPMQWSATSNGGFTTGFPWRDLDPTFVTSNVENELGDPDSLLKYYQDLIRLRNESPALGTGVYLAVRSDNPHVYAALRKSGNEVILVVINLSKDAVTDYSLDYEGRELIKGKYSLQSILGDEIGVPMKVAKNGFSSYIPINELVPYSTYVFRLVK